MKIWIAANNEENFSMFVATCTYNKLKFTFEIGTKGVTPLESTAAVDPFLPVIFPETYHCRMCIRRPCHHLAEVRHHQNLEVRWLFHRPCYRASSWSDFHMSISQGICHKLCNVLLLSAWWLFAQNCFFSSAFICVFCKATSSSFWS